MNGGIDEDLRRAFEGLRRSDEASAPSFSATLSGARNRAPRRRTFLLATAAALVVLVAIAAALLRRSPASPRFAETVAISDWRSPTDFLLQTPGAELLDSLPVLSSPVPDYADASDGPRTPAGEPTRTQKGDRS